MLRSPFDRVHEKNTQHLVLSFLPYHAAPVFPTLLSILPQQMPQTLKFLHPYVQSLVSPPRHAVVYTASSNRPFFAALNAYVLKCCRLSYQYSTLISFWSSVATEATAAMLDQARSARRESQKKNQEDVVHFVLPVLNDGLSLERVSELRVGCYMVLTVLASKADLEDGVITAFMEAVTSDWTQTSHAGLICLSVLAQQRQNPKLHKRVFKAVIALETLEDDLMTLQRQYKVEKLTLGVVLGIVSGLKRARDARQLRLLRTLIEAGLMNETSIAQAIRAILSAAQTLTPETSLEFDVQASLTDLILRLADSKTVGACVENILQTSDFDVGEIEARLQRVIQIDTKSLQMIEDTAVDIETATENPAGDQFDSITSQIPTRTAYEISFLSHSNSYVFGSLENAFLAISPSSTNVKMFSDLPVLRKSLAMSEPLFLSFFIRIWCGSSPATARAAAFRTASDYLLQKELSSDVQILLPYLVYGLGDQSSKVRLAAKDLALALLSTYAKAIEGGDKNMELPILGQENIYGQGNETKELSWLSLNDFYHFLVDSLVPGLEECLLDQTHVSQLLSDNLNSSKYRTASNSVHKELKTSLRLSIFTSLCSHVVSTPLHEVKVRLLQILNRIPKVGIVSRTKLLLPLLSACASKSQEDLERVGHNTLSEFLDQVVGIVTTSDREGLQKLRTIIQPEDYPSSPSLRSAALRRLQIMWPSMNPDMQYSFAKALLEQAIGPSESDSGETQATEAMETLRALPLSSAILQYFVESLPTISSNLQEKPPASKRRCTSHGQSTDPAVLSPKEISYAVGQITLVLELVEDAKVGRHPELLKGLFQVMSDLQHSTSHHKTKTGYLQVLTMDSMLTIVRKLEVRAPVL